MAFIKGYYFTRETDAIQAQHLCNEYYGIPKSPESVTKNWFDYSFAELDKPQFWYILYDESLIPVLGEPTEFTVTQKDRNETAD